MKCKDGPWAGHVLYIDTPTLWFTVRWQTFRYLASGCVEYRS